MKITMYELLGMVKDGKAPKKVKYCDEIFTFNNDDCNFLYKYQVGKCQLFGCCKLNDTVEILDDEEKGLLKKLHHCYTDTDNEDIEFLIKNINDLVDKYNDLLDYLEKQRKGE